MNKATEEKGSDFEWISSIVSITAKAISKTNTLMIDVEEAARWGKVEDFIERWMRDHKRDIVVRLTVNYKKIRGNGGDSSDDGKSRNKVRKVSITVVFRSR